MRNSIGCHQRALLVRLLIEAVFSSYKFWIMKLQSQVGHGNRVVLSEEELGIRN